MSRKRGLTSLAESTNPRFQHLIDYPKTSRVWESQSLQSPISLSVGYCYSDKEVPKDLRVAALRAYAQAMIDRYRAEREKSDHINRAVL
jgi:hypothetical protein